MIPSAIKVRKGSRCLELSYGAEIFQLPYEYLRVYSPSAEVRGHGVGNEVLQFGKKDVNLVKVEPAGNYALKLTFDDGHDSGLYDWNFLHHLCTHQTELWQDYLDKLAQAGKSRDATLINFKSL
ncbi:MAG: DUF971 domain-containing protein [Oleibacter sp.]|nr:DUF971 domain-containing protein [Thalassolituus sp.]